MSVDANGGWLQVGRRALRRVRHSTTHVTRLATRFQRSVVYVLDLLIWSRIFAGRGGLLPIELPKGVLQRKGVGCLPPTLRVGGGCGGEWTHFEAGFAEVYAVLFANLRMTDLLSRYRHALPGPAFRGVYLWDSAFIAQIWRGWDREVAADVLRAVIHLRDGDRLQHVVADFVQSEFTQPPLVAWAAAQVAQRAGAGVDREFVEWAYEPLAAYQAWLRRERRLGNGLYAWAHAYESGVENSPRFGTRDERALRDTRGIGAPDFSAYVVLQCEALAWMAEVLGRDEAAAGWRAEAAALRAVINDVLWHEEDGFYYDRVEASGEWVRSRTVASLMPLWAGVATPERAARVRDHCLDPAVFGALVPLPSVALDDPDFERDMWRGPVWVNLAYAAILGLRRYGFWEAAGELAWRLCDGVFRVFAEERQFYEFYDPSEFSTRNLNRKRGNWWKAFTLGTGPQREFVGWSGLVNVLVIDVIFGLRWEGGVPVLRPVFPVVAAGVRFSLDLPNEGLAVTCEARGDGMIAGVAMWRGTGVAWECRAGDEVALTGEAGLAPRRDEVAG